MNKKIILASQSPRRKELLSSWKIKYEIIIPNIDETTNKKYPSAIVKDLALNKAKAVAKKTTEGIIIAADTIVVCKGEIIGKPKSIEHAKKILIKLSQNPQYVYTGIAIIDKYKNKIILDYDKTKIKFKKIDAKKINELAHKHLDKAGAYAIQEDGDELVEYIKGDFFNVVGLPSKTKILIGKCIN